VILGSGVDIIEVKRIEQAIKRFGDNFLKHVFTDEEIEYAYKRRFPYQHFAARFAAKEAVLKAFGDNAHIGWKDIRIMNDKNGKPVCIYKNKKARKEILISISHTQNYAVASAIITKKP
jgi:holo-[acyl-carrier protein] synthase